MRDFNYTVDVLVKAYLNDTLRHMDCYACAVGNIIADSLNCKFVPSRMDSKREPFEWFRDGVYLGPAWHHLFVMGKIRQKESYRGVVKQQIDATGYSPDELRKIEKAFESCQHSWDKDQWMFNGLMSVVDCLAKIHKVDLKAREEAKLLFVKA